MSDSNEVSDAMVWSHRKRLLAIAGLLYQMHGAVDHPHIGAITDHVDALLRDLGVSDSWSDEKEAHDESARLD